MTELLKQLVEELDALIESDPDAAERLIEKHLARLALRKRLQERKAAQAAEQAGGGEVVGFTPLSELAACPHCGGTIDAPAAPPEPQPKEMWNEWKEALLDKLALTCMDAAVGTPPSKILDQVIAWHVQVERDFGGALSTRHEPSDEEIKALRNRVRVVEETLARCREVLDATAASWREDVDQIDALRRDAERYRWLLENCALGIKQNGNGWSLNTRQCTAPDSLRDVDAAIDAALAARGDN